MVLALVDRYEVEIRDRRRVEDGLDRVAYRMDSQDLRWTVMAIRIQRQVGGNLAEVLHTTAKTMRDRAAMRRQVRALSAEGRLSAYILIALPLLVTLFLYTSELYPTRMRGWPASSPGWYMSICTTRRRNST